MGEVTPSATEASPFRRPSTVRQLLNKHPILPDGMRRGEIGAMHAFRRAPRRACDGASTKDAAGQRLEQFTSTLLGWVDPSHCRWRAFPPRDSRLFELNQPCSRKKGSTPDSAPRSSTTGRAAKKLRQVAALQVEAPHSDGRRYVGASLNTASALSSFRNGAAPTASWWRECPHTRPDVHPRIRSRCNRGNQNRERSSASERNRSWFRCPPRRNRSSWR